VTKLPCGKEVDTDRDQCCVTVCDKPEIGGQINEETKKRLPPRRERSLAVDACPHWAERHEQERRDARRQSRVGH
jgi:hypothetical protein